MGISAVHANAFYSDVTTSKVIWAIKDSNGFPAPQSASGTRSMPFWSSARRAALVIEDVPAYGGFEVISISLDDFCTRWIPGLEKDSLLVGLNWSGDRATGFDVLPSDLLRNLEAACRK